MTQCSVLKASLVLKFYSCDDRLCSVTDENSVVDVLQIFSHLIVVVI